MKVTKLQIKNAKYWHNRQVKALVNSELKANKLLKELAQQYRISFEELSIRLQNLIEAFRLDQKSGGSININVMLTREQILRYLPDLIDTHQFTRLQAIQYQINQNLQKMAIKQIKTVAVHLGSTYQEQFNNLHFELSKVVGVKLDFAKLSNNTVARAVNANFQGENFSDRIWANTDRLAAKLKTTIPQGIILGDSTKTISKTLAEAEKNTMYNATRVVRTETNRIHNQAFQDILDECDFVEQYQFIATLDTRTSKICSSLDLMVFNKKEAAVGINYPPMHPNCRSTTIPFFPEVAHTNRFARDGDGKPIKVPANMTYKEWKKKYIEK